MKKFLIIFTIVVILALGSCAALIFGVFGMIKSSDAYELMFEQASSDPRVIAALGEPVEDGLLVSGSINIENSSGNADLEFDLTGPNGEGKVYGKAVKQRDRWSVTSLWFVHEDDELDLLASD